VHLSAMEACPSYKPWHDKPSGRTFLKVIRASVLHYYFYFIDRDLALLRAVADLGAVFGCKFISTATGCGGRAA